MDKTEQSGLHSEKWPILDMVRVAAALLVVVGHTRYLYFGSPIDVRHSGIGLQFFYLLTGLSRQAVLYFFVISGFLVGGPIVRLIKENRFDLWKYLVNRFARIYIVFLPALALAFILSAFASLLLVGTSEHRDLLDGWSDFNLPCHLAGLQGIACVSHADPPLWSLGYEWLLYLVAPAFLSIVLSSFDWKVRVTALLLCGLILYSVLPQQTDWRWLFFWFAGVAANQILAFWRLPLGVGFAGVLLAAAASLVVRATLIPTFVTDICTVTGLVLAFGCRPLMTWKRFDKIFSRLAAFSYSLYAIHLPIVVLCARVLEWLGEMNPEPEVNTRATIAFVLSVAIAAVAAFGFASATEANTSLIRRAVLSRSGLKEG
jgi:peptidoglycan/LPS O-acetylase OafA/YrhL